MGRLHVGLSDLSEDIARYQSKFNLVELRLDPKAMPRPQKLRAWRKAVGPSFAFSVVLPPAVSRLAPASELDPELESAIEAAVALEAKAIVLGTGSDVRPTQTNIKRLRSIFARLPKPAVTLCWEPQGIWERAEILGHAREFEAIPVFDAARDALAPGPVAYTRIRALGASVVGPQLVDRLAAALRARRESFVVVEHAPSARRLRKELSERLGKGAAAGPQVRAVPGRLRAEDEEQ